jgi:bile acid:Na+ symporter, BASS family
MQSTVLTAAFLPAAVGIIMLGLGLSLTPADFRRVFVYPRAVLVGLLCQTILLPLIAFGLAKAFALPPELAVGLMLLAASPGGASANLFSHLARGDVALNITLTAVNSVLSLVTLPLLLGLSLAAFMDQDKSVPIQFGKVLQVVAIVIIPVVLGMLVRSRKPALAERLDRPVRITSAVLLAIIVIAALIQQREILGAAIVAVGLAALTFNLLSMGVGYFVPRLVGLDRRQAIACGMEIGIHNAALAIAIADKVLANETMAIPPAIYGVLMFFTAAAFGVLISRRKDP